MLYEWANWLSDRGHDVKVYAPPLTFGGRVSNKAKHMGTTAYSEGWRQKIDADVAYVFYYGPTAWRFLFDIRCPKIAGLHAPGILSKTSIRHHLFRIIGSQDMSSFDAVHVQSQIFKFQHKRIFDIPATVNTKLFRIRRTDSKRFTIFFAGRQDQDKGWKIFAEAASRLSNAGHKFDFISTGEGSQTIKGLGAIDHKDMPNAYAKAHIFAYPAWADTFGLVILEAAACGLPVITTPIAAHKAINLPLKYIDNVEGCVQEIINLYQLWDSDPNSFKNLSRSMRKNSLNYDTDGVFTELESMLKNVSQGID